MARPKKNNAEYFTHDADMRNDVKIKALRRKFSHTGYAVWNYLLETLTDSDFFEIEWEEINIELLAADYDVSIEELSEIVCYCVKIGLLQQNGDKLYSGTHKERLNCVITYRDKQSVNGKKGGNPNFKRGQPNLYYTTEKDNQKITDPYHFDEETLPKDKHSKEEYSRVKKSKEEERKETILSDSKEKEISPPPPILILPPENLKTKKIEEIFENLKNDKIWLETVAINAGISSAVCQSMYTDFLTHLQATGEDYKTTKDFKAHFANWVRTVKQKTNADTGKTGNNTGFRRKNFEPQKNAAAYPDRGASVI